MIDFGVKDFAYVQAQTHLRASPPRGQSSHCSSTRPSPLLFLLLSKTSSGVTRTQSDRLTGVVLTFLGLLDAAALWYVDVVE